MATEPTTPKGQRTRQTILDAASKVFTRDGYVDARMSDVAEQAGLSLGGLYRYFENKEDLFGSVIRDLHEELFRRSRSSTPIAEDPEVALFEANLGYLQHYRDNSGVLRAFIEATTVEERFTTIWWTMRERHVDNDTSNRYRMRHMGSQDASASCLVNAHDHILGPHTSRRITATAGRRGSYPAARCERAD